MILWWKSWKPQNTEHGAPLYNLETTHSNTRVNLYLKLYINDLVNNLPKLLINLPFMNFKNPLSTPKSACPVKGGVARLVWRCIRVSVWSRQISRLRTHPFELAPKNSSSSHSTPHIFACAALLSAPLGCCAAMNSHRRFSDSHIFHMYGKKNILWNNLCITLPTRREMHLHLRSIENSPER